MHSRGLFVTSVFALLLACCGGQSTPPTAPMTPTEVAVTPASSSSATNPAGVGDEPREESTTTTTTTTPSPPPQPTQATIPNVPPPPTSTPPFPGGPAFDRGAAARALGGVNVQSCKQPNQPTGAGHVTITFDPSGGVSSASVDGGPFPGTPVGACIANKFRGANIPTFAGTPVRVGKSFVIQ